jgi:4Fe-4S ferredoxin
MAGKRKKLDECVPLFEEDKYKEKREKLAIKLLPLESAGETGLIIHPEKCFGCGKCVVACPVNVAAEPTRCGAGLGPETDKAILRVENGVVACNNLKECWRYGPNKTLCNACTATCPSQAIEFV